MSVRIRAIAVIDDVVHCSVVTDSRAPQRPVLELDEDLPLDFAGPLLLPVEDYPSRSRLA
jgi:hypothetical protein